MAMEPVCASAQGRRARVRGARIPQTAVRPRRMRAVHRIVLPRGGQTQPNGESRPCIAHVRGLRRGGVGGRCARERGACLSQPPARQQRARTRQVRGAPQARRAAVGQARRIRPASRCGCGLYACLQERHSFWRGAGSAGFNRQPAARVASVRAGQRTAQPNSSLQGLWRQPGVSRTRGAPCGRATQVLKTMALACRVR